MKLLITSDLHGDCAKYEAINAIVEEQGIGAVLNGGDLLSHGGSNRLKDQRSAVCALESILSRCPCPVYLQCGNDDLLGVLPDLVGTIGRLPHVHRLDGHWHDLDGVWISGYCCIPDSPFPTKDWCRLDGTPGWERPPQPHAPKRSDPGGMIPLAGDGRQWLEQRNTIARDLDRLTPPGGVGWDRCLMVFHAPPHNTDFDLTMFDMHVGSPAIGSFITRKQPLLSVFGHIHETVEMSGRWRGDIDGALCAAVGQRGPLRYLTVDTADVPGTLVRRDHPPGTEA